MLLVFGWLWGSGALAQSESFFVNVRSSQWNVVFRAGLSDTRVERMAAQCAGTWVNVCASWVLPEQRQRALRAGLQPGVAAAGDARTCGDLRLPRMDGATLQRQVLSDDARAFCEVLRPGSAAAMTAPAPLAPPPAPLASPPAPGRQAMGPIPPRPPAPVVQPRPAPAFAPPRSPAPLGSPADQVDAFELPTVTAARSLEEFGIIDLDAEEDPKARKQREREERRERRQREKEEVPALRDRRLPQ